MEMVIVDALLQEREQDAKPLFVGIVASWYIARGIASQLLQSPVEMRLAAIANRTVARAEQILCEGGRTDFKKSVQLLTPLLDVVSA